MDKQQADLRELYEDVGFSLREIAYITGLPRTTVYYRLRRMGVTFRSRGGERGGRRVSHQDMEATIRLYRAGLTITEVGQILGRRDASIWCRLENAGIERRSPAESLRLKRERLAA